MIKTKKVMMSPHEWDDFRKVYRLSPMKGGGCVKHLDPPHPYPRMHFKCKYTTDYVLIEVHYDYDIHSSFPSSLNDAWYECMKAWVKYYSLRHL